MAKQTTLTIETDSLLILRGQTSNHAWCPQCSAEGEMIEVENLRVVSNLEPQALHQWLNSAELHRLQTPGGSVLICMNSLLARVENARTSTAQRLQLEKETR